MTAAWNDLAISWAQYFGAAVLQNTLFLAFVLVALHLLRNAPARTRHTVALVGLVKLLVPPFLALPITNGALKGAVPLEGGFTPLIFGGSLPTREVAGPVYERPGVLAIFLLFWVVGAALWLGGSAICTWRLSWRLKSSEPVPFSELPNPLPEGVSVHRSARIAMPLTLGPWPRRIYVPPAWDDWDSECRALAIRHELEHLNRRDGLWQGLQLLVRGLYFFHPLVWLLDRELNATREMSVDDATAGTGPHAGMTYSHLLMNIADSLVCGRETCSTAAALFRRRRELMGRIRYQLEKGETMKTWTGKTIIVTIVLLALAVPLSWHVDASVPDGAVTMSTAGEDPTPTDEAKKTKQMKAEMKAKEDGEPVELKISIRGDDTVDLKGHAMTMADFEQKLLGSGLKERDDVVFTIVCDKKATMGDVHVVSAVLRQVSKAPKVRFVNGDHKKLPMVLPPMEIEKKLASLAPEDRADVAIAANGVVTYNGKKLSVAKLGKVAAKEIQGNPKLVLALSSDVETSYFDFTAVLEELKKAEVDRIAILPPKGVKEITTTAANP